MEEPSSCFRAFRDGGQRLTCVTGEVIFSIGEPGDKMYVVDSGTVAMRAVGELLEVVEAGGIFGEMALVDDEPRSATAVAVTDCELVAIDAERFKGLLSREPAFGLEVMRVMADRLRRRTHSGVPPLPA